MTARTELAAAKADLAAAEAEVDAITVGSSNWAPVEAAMTHYAHARSRLLLLAEIDQLAEAAALVAGMVAC